MRNEVLLIRPAEQMRPGSAGKHGHIVSAVRLLLQRNRRGEHKRLHVHVQLLQIRPCPGAVEQLTEPGPVRVAQSRVRQPVQAGLRIVDAQNIIAPTRVARHGHRVRMVWGDHNQRVLLVRALSRRPHRLVQLHRLVQGPLRLCLVVSVVYAPALDEQNVPVLVLLQHVQRLRHHLLERGATLVLLTFQMEGHVAGTEQAEHVIVPQRIHGLQFVFGVYEHSAARLMVQPLPRFQQVHPIPPFARLPVNVGLVLGQELLPTAAHNDVQVAAHLAIDQLFGNIGAIFGVASVPN